jgi:hypothetical protein
MWVFTVIFVLWIGDTPHFRHERRAFASQAECEAARHGVADALMAQELGMEGWLILITPLPCEMQATS